MATRRTSRVLGVVAALFAVAAVWACNRGGESRGPEYAAAADAPRGGFVGPLQDDTSDDHVSWVDGQVVTDWGAEIARRDRAIEAYLNGADPGRAAKYGFRSGQHPPLAWSWFTSNPVGFNGVPFVIYCVVAKSRRLPAAAARRPRRPPGPDGRVRHRVRAGGHPYAPSGQPDATGLDPVRDRREIETRILGSPVGALLAYLKTL